MTDDDSHIQLRGAALRALVHAAEAPVVGRVVKERLMAQMDVEELFEIDLRRLGDPPPASVPRPPTIDEASE